MPAAAASTATAPKAKRSRWRTAAYGLIAWAVFMAAWLSWLAFSTTLPTCAGAADMLRETFDASPAARAGNLTAVDVLSIAETGRDKTAGTRQCSARILLNSNRGLRVTYDLVDRGGGEYLLTFEAAP